ncbi:Protein of unknown function [Pyronema omphalodes CBS 100304]|nr:Protein of unknown function [Pyronema omphalodes CBS 100304]
MYDDANRLMKPICYNPVIIQVTITSGTSTNSPKNLPISDWRKPELAVADAPSPLHSLIWRTRLRKSAERECSRMLSPAHRLQRERAEELPRAEVGLEIGTESFEIQSMAGQPGTDGSRTNSSMRGTISTQDLEVSLARVQDFNDPPDRARCTEARILDTAFGVSSALRPDYSRYNKIQVLSNLERIRLTISLDRFPTEEI